ncbi:MAG TPA: hypothetical protein VGN54_06180, partial [Mycobacteriales bacterium]|nr:hypothetical protein [Mycobacteriales bacterium]
HGWTQQAVAARLAQLTGHELPQASISAMERGFDGDRRRRFDAHELYLLSVVFDVPITYFFLPPAEPGLGVLADTGRPIAELYPTLLGLEHQLPALDERLTDIGLADPAGSNQALATIFGADHAAGNWHQHFRTWRKRRLLAIERHYGDRLDEIAEFFAVFAAEIKATGPQSYLQMKAHRDGEDVLPADAQPEEA